MYFSPLLDSAGPPRSCVLALLNFFFVRRDFFLLLVFSDFDLCGPTPLDLLVGGKKPSVTAHCLVDRYPNQFD